MTREDIEKIVEKTVEWLNGYAFTDDDKSAHIPTLIHDFLKDSRVYFDDLSQPSLPSNLDEAANNYGRDIRLGYPRVMDETDRYIYNAFKAGAEWMASQWVTVEGIARPDDCEIWANLTGYDFNDGDKVIVQIRKA